ncbi:MAG: pimeloyl-ACP methyl ester carboxylesterase [Roseivirga sp.]|jgi:pimeloyl-ACP methyl ester carboxylesterase
MLPKKITISDSTLEYSIFPGGSRSMLCFHGFGQDRTAYQKVYETLTASHTVYSFDLPYHGSTLIPKSKAPLLPAAWMEFMKLFLKEEAISSFEVMGYSMGGKYAMITTQLFPNQIEHLHLISPDGITTHFSYKFTTYPYLFRKLFKTQIKNPWVFSRVVKSIRTLKLMNNYTLRFAESQMDTEFKRSQVYYSWVNLRHFLPDLKKLSSLINEHKIKTTFYLGKHDKVISLTAIKPLLDLIPLAELKVLESGHTQLVGAVAKEFDNNPID